MKETTVTINIPDETIERRRPRSAKKKKGRRRLLFLVLLVALFGLSYGITSLVLRFSNASAPVEEPPAVETQKPDKPEGASPSPVTDPKLPTILKDHPVSSEEPVEDPAEEPEGEEPSEEPTDEPNEKTPTEEEPLEEEPEGETTPENDIRTDGLR